MPVRFLNSSVFTWPDRAEVEGALSRWAKRESERRDDLLRVGYFGSYARGEQGVGSDLDVVIVVEKSDLPKARRPVEWSLGALPVPADLIVLTRAEWGELLRDQRRFARMLATETVWLYERQ